MSWPRSDLHIWPTKVAVAAEHGGVVAAGGTSILEVQRRMTCGAYVQVGAGAWGAEGSVDSPGMLLLRSYGCLFLVLIWLVRNSLGGGGPPRYVGLATPSDGFRRDFCPFLGMVHIPGLLIHELTAISFLFTGPATIAMIERDRRHGREQFSVHIRKLVPRGMISKIVLNPSER